MSRNAEHWLTNEPSLHSQWAAESDAITGSKALRRECEQLFWRFAQRHRITPEEARVLIVSTGIKL